MDKNANDGEYLVTARDNVGEGWKIKAPFPCGDCLDSSRGGTQIHSWDAMAQNNILTLANKCI